MKKRSERISQSDVSISNTVYTFYTGIILVRVKINQDLFVEVLLGSRRDNAYFSGFYLRHDDESLVTDDDLYELAEDAYFDVVMDYQDAINDLPY